MKYHQNPTHDHQPAFSKRTTSLHLCQSVLNTASTVGAHRISLAVWAVVTAVATVGHVQAQPVQAQNVQRQPMPVAQQTAGNAPKAPAATPLSLAKAAEPSLTYIVQPQDTLSVLSRTLFNGRDAWANIAQHNGLKSPHLIYTGQKLDVPLRYLASTPSGGRVISASGEVSVQGQPLVPGTAVRAGQQFKTGPDGSVKIELGDGSRIKLLPNTLAEVVSNSDYAMRDSSASGSTNWFSGIMRLTSGALEAFAAKRANRATPLQIQTPTSAIGVRGTEFRVAFNDPANLSVRTEVLEGLVRADGTLKGVGSNLPMGTGAVVKAGDKDIEVFNLLQAPDPSAISAEVFLPQALLSLPKQTGIANYRVLIAKDEQFDSVVRDLKVPTAASADLSGLAAGNWYALIRGVDSIGLEGFNTIKLISIKDAPPADPFRPDSNRLISLSANNGQTRISWTALPSDPAVKSYIALIGQDQARLQALAGTDSASRDINLGQLQPGTYYLRLRTVLASGAVSESALYRFELNGNWGQTVFGSLSAVQIVN